MSDLDEIGQKIMSLIERFHARYDIDTSQSDQWAKHSDSHKVAAFGSIMNDLGIRFQVYFVEDDDE